MENTENNSVVSIETKKKEKKDHSKAKTILKDIGLILLGSAGTIGLAMLFGGGNDGDSNE